MKGYFKTIGLLLFAFFIESVFLRWPIFNAFQPNLFLIILVASAFRYGPVVGCFSGFSLGIIQDVYMVNFLGANAFVKCLVIYIVGLFDKSHFVLTYTSKGLILYLAVVFHDVLYNIFTGYSLFDALFFFVLNGLWPSIVTVLLGSLFFYVYEKKWSS